MGNRKKYTQEYINYLNKLVDEIFAEGAKRWDWEFQPELKKWANRADLHYSTIWKLGTRETKVPQLLTVWKLAKSVGWSLTVNKKISLKRRAA